MHPLQQGVLRRLAAARVGVVDQHDEADALAVQGVHIAGQRADAAQGAGFEVRAAAECAAVETQLQGAVAGDDRQCRLELGVQRAVVGGPQQLVQRVRADALDARQPGAVFQHQLAGRHAALRQYLTHRLCAFFQRRRRAVFFRAERQEQIARHQVVGMFVEAGERIGQRLRGEFQQRLGAGRHPRQRRAGQRAARLRPQPAKNEIEGRGRLEQVQRPGLLAAAARIAPAHHQFKAFGVGDGGRERILPAVAFRAVGRHQARGQRHPRQRDIRHDQHLFSVRLQAQRRRVEVGHQRPRRGVVQGQRLAVEGAGVDRRQLEMAEVEHQIAVDVAHPAGAQFALQQPHPLQRQGGIAMALDDEVAAQHAVRDDAVGPDIGRPRVAGAELVQRREAGRQLHHRGRIQRRFGIVAEHGRRRIQRLHHHRHMIERDAGLLQSIGEGRGKPDGMGGRDKACEQQAGEKMACDSERHHRVIMPNFAARVSRSGAR